MTAAPEFKPSPAAHAGCELCQQAGGLLLWHSDAWRVVRVLDDAFPAYYRVISNAHVAEFSALPETTERQRCMNLVSAIEQVLLRRLAPTKVNLAALGNVVPHLHWHVVARFEWDSHFPQPIWAAPQRAVQPAPLSRLGCSLAELDAAVLAALPTANAP